jgi:hypothetical protein
MIVELVSQTYKGKQLYTVQLLKRTKFHYKVVFHIPAPFIFDPLNDVLPVVSAPSKLALLKLTYRKHSVRIMILTGGCLIMMLQCSETGI